MTVDEDTPRARLGYRAQDPGNVAAVLFQNAAVKVAHQFDRRRRTGPFQLLVFIDGNVNIIRAFIRRAVKGSFERARIVLALEGKPQVDLRADAIIDDRLLAGEGEQ